MRLTTEPASLCPWMGFGLEMVLGLALEDICSDGIFSLGLGADEDDSEDDDEGLGVSEELGLPAESLEMGLGMSPELRLGLELL